MPKPGEVINIPARVLHVLQEGGQTILVLKRLDQPAPKGSTQDDGSDGGSFAVMWGT